MGHYPLKFSFSFLMIGGLFMNQDLLISSEEFLENELLSKRDLEDYDLDRTFYMVCNFIKRYKRLKCKSYNEPQIKVTTKYKFIFVDESHSNPNQYTQLDKLIDDKTEYYKISNQLTSVTELFTEEEKVYFTISLYNGRSETTAFKEIGCSNKGLIPIKNSCIVKFACAFDIEVYKGDLLSEDDEEKFKNFMELK